MNSTIFKQFTNNWLKIKNLLIGELYRQHLQLDVPYWMGWRVTAVYCRDLLLRPLCCQLPPLFHPLHQLPHDIYERHCETDLRMNRHHNCYCYLLTKRSSCFLSSKIHHNTNFLYSFVLSTINSGVRTLGKMKIIILIMSLLTALRVTLLKI